MLVDAHAHISATAYGNVEAYLARLREAGIDQGVVVPGGMVDVRRMTDYITGRAKPEKPVPDNDYVETACNSYHATLYGFICVNPHDPDGLAVLEKGFRRGCRGLKLSPLTHQFSFASKALAAMAEFCGNYGYPLYSHVVYSPGASTSRFIALARQFPKTNFILGHMGFGPADQEALEAAVELDNFFLETSTGSFIHIQEATRKAGAGKILFGSEFPLSHPVVELEKILLLDVTDDEREKILGMNICRLLRLV